MISFHRLSDLSSIGDLKQAYLKRLAAPLDGMWDAISNQSGHWEVCVDGARVGYYIADDDGTLLQFYLAPSFQEYGVDVLGHITAQNSVSGALVSTADPFLLSLIPGGVDGSPVHTYLYELPESNASSAPGTGELPLRPVGMDELERTVAFQQSCLSGNDDLTDWLMRYSKNLIDRTELHVLDQEGEWIGLGECRRSDSQPGIADLGVMVTPDHRGNGWATDILNRLIVRCADEGLRPICSTTVSNVAAQRAISKAGFVSRYQLMEVAF